MIGILKKDYSGYPYKANVKTNAYCFVTTSNSQKENEIEYGNIIKMFAEIFKATYGLYVLNYNCKEGEFNAVEKHNGVWKPLKLTGKCFENISEELYYRDNGKSLVLSYAKVMDAEIPYLFKLNFPIIVLANDKIIKKLLNCDNGVLFYPEKIKEFLLANKAVIMEYLNIGVDGSSLFVYSKF